MNNVSFTAAIVTVIAAFLEGAPGFAGNLPMQKLMWWSLALGVCLGGNGTLVGAAANLVTAGIAEKAGVTVNFRTFMRYSVPVTCGTLLTATLYVAIRYYILNG